MTALVSSAAPGSEVTTMEVREEVRESPSFVEPLKPVTINDGEEVILTCVVKGKPMPTVTWFCNDTGADKNDDYIIKFNDSTGRCELIIVECFTEDSGLFRCVATNEFGETSTCAELTVNAISVSESLISEDDVMSETLDLDITTPITTVKLGSSEAVTSHEFVMSLPQVTGSTTFNVEPSDEAFTMTIGEPFHASQIVVDVGSAVTEEFTLAGTGDLTTCSNEVQIELPQQTVTGTQEFTISGSEAASIEFAMAIAQDDTTAVTFLEPIRPQVVKEGDNATFVAKATGKPEVITWFKNQNKLESTDILRMDFDVDSGAISLTIVKAMPEDAGNYSLEASNSAGTARCTANLVVVRKYKSLYFYISQTAVPGNNLTSF